jgi:hypothetical protein
MTHLPSPGGQDTSKGQLMRSLRLVFGKNGTMTTLVLAAVMPLGAACGGDVDNGHSGTMGTGGLGGSGGSAGQVGGATNAGGTSTGGAAGAAGSAAGGTSAGGSSDYSWSTTSSNTSVPSDFPYGVTSVPSEQCVNGWSSLFEAMVPLPPEGTPPNPTALCSATPATPQDSGWAARITLTTNASDTSKAQGIVSIASELVGSVVGMPSVKVVDLDSSLTVPTLSETVAVASNSSAFGFTLTFGSPVYGATFGTPPRIVLETRFTIKCGNSTREVRALTALYFCSDIGMSNSQAVGWASSGDRCIDCASICEMVASPILPAKGDESTPLASAVRLGLRVIGRLHGALVILAEHDGGASQFDYRWSATSGKLVWVDGDVALWVPPESTNGQELVQVAMSSQRVAAVASLRWDALA